MEVFEIFHKFKRKVNTQEKVKEFESLLEPIYIDLFKFIFVMTKNKIVTDDVMQDSLLKAYNNFHKLKDKEKFKSWIFTIAKNQTMEVFKKFSRNKESLVNDNILHSISSSDESLDQIIIKEETKNQIIKIINELKEEYKEVLILHYYCDLSFEEISHILNRTPSTIRTWHLRAKKGVYVKLKNREEFKEMKGGMGL